MFGCVPAAMEATATGHPLPGGRPERRRLPPGSTPFGGILSVGSHPGADAHHHGAYGGILIAGFVFTEKPGGLSAQTLLDLVEMENGENVRVKRAERDKNLRWRILFEPRFDRDVTLWAPASSEIILSDGRTCGGSNTVTLPYCEWDNHSPLMVPWGRDPRPSAVPTITTAAAAGDWRWLGLMRKHLGWVTGQ